MAGPKWQRGERVGAGHTPQICSVPAQLLHPYQQFAASDESLAGDETAMKKYLQVCRVVAWELRKYKCPYTYFLLVVDLSG